MKKLKLFLLFTCCYACVVPKIELTEQEKDLEGKVKKEFACEEFEFRHDYHAIKENRKDATFMVALCDDFCNKDSITLCKEAIRLTKMIKPVLSLKEKYEGLTFFTSVEKHLDQNSSVSTCYKTIEVSLRDLKVVEYSR